MGLVILRMQTIEEYLKVMHFENSNAAYIVHVGVNEPTINDDTQFYQRYQVYKIG